MAFPRKGGIVRTTYLGYLDREPAAACSAIGSYRSVDTKACLEHLRRGQAPRMASSISSQAAIEGHTGGKREVHGEDLATPWAVPQLRNEAR